MPRDGFSLRVTGLKELSQSLDRLSRETNRRFGQPAHIPVQFELDDDRYLDRTCPAPECRSGFKVLWDDYRSVVRDEAAYCVVCRHEAEAQDFHTPGQREYLTQIALGHVTRELAESFRAARLDFRPRRQLPALSPAATEALLQRTTCSSCGCRYASLGSSFFCAACGHHAALDTFAGTMKTVRKTLEVALHGDLATDPDLAADMRRGLIEAALERSLHAFEAYAGQRYRQLAPDRRKPRKTAFQNLDASNKLWRSVIGRDYTDVLTEAEYADFARLIQQRHLAHMGGLVDQEYIDKTGDRTYRVGQRVIVTAAAVERMVEVVEKLAGELIASEAQASGPAR